MLRLSVALSIVFTLISVSSRVSAIEGGSIWPVKGSIDLSSGFGDLRSGRFHSGLDIRTGGKVGQPLLSPVDGYVWRVKMSYYGYGKGLYLKGDDGYLYVLAHLMDFVPKIRKPVQLAQVAAERYYVDLYFPPDSIRVEKGEHIGFTGKTGVGAPHLHFEKRTADNIPINPLAHGLSIKDNTKPVFRRLGIQLMDQSSLLGKGQRRIFVPLKRDAKTGVYVCDTIISMSSPFGLMADCFDLNRPGGMKRAVYSLSVLLDDKPFYQVTFDSLRFDFNEFSRLEYDYEEAVNHRKRVRNLFARRGNGFVGSKAHDSNGGIIGADGRLSDNLHTLRIIAKDEAGNQAEAQIDFVWIGSGQVFHLDSIVNPEPARTQFYLTANPVLKKINLDSLRVFRTRQEQWYSVSRGSLIDAGNSQFIYEYYNNDYRTACLRIAVFHSGNSLIEDRIFNGIQHGSGKRIDFEYEVMDDGIRVSLSGKELQANYARVELYYRDSLLGIEYPRLFHMSQHYGIIPPKPEYARIDRFGYCFGRDTTITSQKSDPVDIRLVGIKETEDIDIDGLLTLHLGKKYFYKPRYLEFKVSAVPQSNLLKLNSLLYQILPEAFVCREDFKMTLKLRTRNEFNKRSGICWLDKEEDKWVWLDNSFDNHVLTAWSSGGGSFSSVFDYEAPLIRRLNIRNGSSMTRVRPKIGFYVEDTLSGVYDDEDIRIELDGKWLIPEYDPEDSLVIAIPREDLAPGKHHLGIILTDRAGNKTEQYLQFTVKKKR